MNEIKNIFSGHRRKTEEEIQHMLEDGLIAFDANVLLNLYRYSSSTREAFLDIISKFSDKIFLPHQVVFEYSKNRYDVIVEQENAYKEFQKSLTKIQEDIESTSKHPFLSKKLEKSLLKVFDEVNNEVNRQIDMHASYLKSDPIYDKLNELFKGKVTESFNDAKINEIEEEGENRYQDKIPPGYEDSKNKSDRRKYGDLIIWKQIIKHAKQNKKDILLITDDGKEDWWWKLKDKRNMGPRPELIEELKRETGVDFHMYSSERFLEYSQEFLNEKINQKALEEILAIKEAERKKQMFFQESEYEYTRRRLKNNKEQINILRDRLSFSQDKLRRYEEKIMDLSLSESSSDIQLQLINNLRLKSKELKHQAEALKRELELLEQEKTTYRNRLRKFNTRRHGIYDEFENDE